MNATDYTLPGAGLKLTISLCLVIVGSVVKADAAEEPPYTLEKQADDFEIRAYNSQVVAETVVQGDIDEAGNRGFRPLFNYISGDNRSKTKIAMTAPVGQQKAKGEKIAMTAPVGQQASSNGWAVTFMMPASYTMQTLPEPLDDRVRLREIPPTRMAVVRYSGRWSAKGYERNLERLRTWMREQNLEADGDPTWARYNSPFSIPLLRRNEVLIPLKASE